MACDTRGEEEVKSLKSIVGEGNSLVNAIAVFETGSSIVIPSRVFIPDG